MLDNIYKLIIIFYFTFGKSFLSAHKSDPKELLHTILANPINLSRQALRQAESPRETGEDLRPYQGDFPSPDKGRLGGVCNVARLGTV